MTVEPLRNIYRVNLGVARNEKVLVFADTISRSEHLAPEMACRRERLRDIGLLMAEMGRSFARTVKYSEYEATGTHGKEPPEILWAVAFGDKTVSVLEAKGLLDRLISKEISPQELVEVERIVTRHRRSAVHAVIALAHFSTSHTRFRDLLTRVCGTRYASMPLFEIGMLEGVMQADWKSLARRTRTVAAVLDRAEEIAVECPNGTHLHFSKRGRLAVADTGILTRPGSFGNLPAGEAFLAPLEGTAEGKLVIEWAPARMLTSPVSLTISAGIVSAVEGDEPFAERLRDNLDARPENGNIAEFGVGTNDRATRPDSILESEKILGTIHVALGDNSSFGGTVATPFHQDYVFFRPTVTLTGRRGGEVILLRDGKPIFGTQ